MKKFLLGVMVLFSCCTGRDFNKVFLRSYVMYYYDVESIRLWSGDVDIPAYPGELKIRIGGNISHTKSARYNTEHTTLYDALCLKHNDMTFNRRVKYPTALSPITYPMADFISIEVISDADYDASHTAGSLLNDLITVYYDSAKQYIDSGYTEYNKEGMGIIRYSKIVKNLADVSADDLVLLGDGDTYLDDRGGHFDFPTLIFESEPTLSKTHNFTVTMTADDGRVFSDSIEVTFE